MTQFWMIELLRSRNGWSLCNGGSKVFRAGVLTIWIPIVEMTVLIWIWWSQSQIELIICSQSWSGYMSSHARASVDKPQASHSLLQSIILPNSQRRARLLHRLWNDAGVILLNWTSQHYDSSHPVSNMQVSQTLVNKLVAILQMRKSGHVSCSKSLVWWLHWTGLMYQWHY